MLHDYPYPFHIQIVIPDSYQSGKGPAGKLADAELFIHGGPLEGLRLGGFTVWSNSKSVSGINVTFPARTYMAGGVKRSYTLLRDITPAGDVATTALVKLITAAYIHAKQHSPNGGVFNVDKEFLKGAVPNSHAHEGAEAAFVAAAQDLL